MDENGKIDLKLRTGKPLTDAYSTRSKNLKKKCNELTKITGAYVKFYCRPPWDGGVCRSFNNFPGGDGSSNLVEKPLPVASPTKKQKSCSQQASSPTTASIKVSMSVSTPKWCSLSAKPSKVSQGYRIGKGGQKRLGLTD